MRRTLLLVCWVFANLFLMSSQTVTSVKKSTSPVGNYVNSYDNRNLLTWKAYKKQSLSGKSVVLHHVNLAKTVVLSETFDNGALPDGWSNVENKIGGGIWFFNNPGGKTINTTTGSTGFAIFDSDYLNGDNYAEDADLISPTIDCSSLTTVFLSFEHYFLSGYDGYGEILVSDNNGSTWTSLESWGSSSTDNAALAIYDITALAAGKSQVKVKWNWQGDYSWYWAVDDIRVYEPYDHELGVQAITPLEAVRHITVTPVVTILNDGASAESGYSVTLSDGGSYSNTVNVTSSVDVGSTYDVIFPAFTASESQYILTATVTLSTDENSSNDTLTDTLKTYHYRAGLASVDNSGSSANGIFWIPTNEFQSGGTSTQLRGLAWKDSVLYGITFEGTFGRINFSDASFTAIGETEIPATFFTSLSYDPVTGKIYASALSGLYPDFTVGLYEINTATGIGALVGESSTTGTFLCFAFDNSGQLYAIRHIPDENGILYAVNKNNAEMTLIDTLGSVVSVNYQAMAYDIHENTMFFQAYDDEGSMNGTYMIELETGKATLVGTPFNNQIVSMEMPDLDANLKGLRVDGSTIGNFSPGKFTYQVVLPSGTTAIPEVTATAFYEVSSASVTNATSLPGTASVLVTAYDGTTHTYTVSFSVSANSNAELSDMQVDGSPVAGFSKGTTDYNILLPSGTSAVPTVTVTTVDDNASASISDAASLPGSTTITVTAADGSTQLVYTVNFTVEPVTDATLKSLRYNGFSIEDFNSAINTYAVEFPYGTTHIPYVRGTATDLNASVSISDASSLPGSATVTVTAADGSTQLVYTINFTVALPSTDASLSDLTVNGTTVTGFSTTVYEYNVELPYGTTDVPNVGATVNDNTATSVVTNAASLQSAATVVVTAQDGTTQLTYTINFTVSTVSDVNDLKENTLNVFPVPANDKINIESEEPINTVTILDLNGQRIFAAEYNSTNIVVNVSGLNTGIYFMGICTSEGVIYKKIQVNR